MESSTLYSLAGTLLVSIVALVGILTLSLKRAWLDKILMLLISLSAGALLGDSFIHLLPEAAQSAGGFTTEVGLMVLLGLVGFFILEKFILWHHHHSIETPEDHRSAAHTHDLCEKRSLRVMNLVGDGFHNLLDGMIIAASFSVSPVVGASTTIAVLLHEIPQEIGDFGVLIHSGISVKRALFYNFLSGTIAILGALLVIFIGNGTGKLIQALIPITAGAFIYIAASDLIPELKKLPKVGSSVMQLMSLLVGIGLMVALLFVE